MAFLDVRGISKVFGKVAALEDVTVGVEDGCFFSLLGPSGCGKSTLLRTIAGLVQQDRGVVVLEGKDITGLPPYSRDIGMVFQDFALFPHMSVYQNIGFGLRMRGVSQDTIRTRVRQAVSLAQLEGLEGRRPQHLSGGEQQRVALARALVTEPKVLLLDEPLSQLDAKLRKSVQIWIRGLQRKLKITTIYVTHDQAEALALSDVVGIMRSGRIVQKGAPKEIYRNPAGRFVADFVGASIMFDGLLKNPNNSARQLLFVSDLGEEFKVLKRERGELPGRCRVFIRPEDVVIAGESTASQFECNIVGGRVEEIIFEGATSTIRLTCDSGREILLEKQQANWVEGRLAVRKKVVLYFPPEAFVVTD